MLPLPSIQPFSLQDGNLDCKKVCAREKNPIHNLVELITKTFTLRSEEQKSENFISIALSIHKFLPQKINIALFIEEMEKLLDRCSLEKASDLKLFLKSWILHGSLSYESLVDIKHMIVRKQKRDSYEELLKIIDDQAPSTKEYTSKASQTTPKTNMLAWMNKTWTSVKISAALSELCVPFYELRAGEFIDEMNSGPNLTLLNRRCSNITSFVTASILSAATDSQKRAKKTAEKWLAVAESLHQRNNFHMMFAIHNGLQVNTLQRLEWLFSDLSRQSSKTMNMLGRIFNVEDKMRQLTETTESLAGKECIIPCIYWLYHKALLTRETPLYLENGSINTQVFVSASNIFRNMTKMQSLRYNNLKTDAEVFSYFLSLDHDPVNPDEDKLYKVSDEVRAKKGNSLLALKPKLVSFEEAFCKTALNNSLTVIVHLLYKIALSKASSLQF